MKLNILANFVGRFWGILSNFLFIPLYIKYLGLESFSIIGLSLVITAVLAVMDSGLTSTLTREFASSENSKKERLSIFKTLESCYFIISSFAILLVVLGSTFIATKWLNLDDISPDLVAYYLKIIGIEIGFKFLAQFYTGGFIGLEKQVKVNVYQIIWGVTRNGLVVIPIIFYPTLEVFFLWQTISTILYVLVIRWDIITVISKRSSSSFFSKPVIQKSIIKKIWKFAGGMMLISAVAAINTQLDKVALTKLLPIEVLGLYTLAFSLSSGLNLLSRPFSMAILPRITNYFTSGRQNDASLLFKKAYIIVAIIIFSFMSSMIIYSQELIWIWTNDIELAQKSYIYVPWIALGTGFLALQGLPFNIAIAHSFTKYNNILGILSLIITIPGYWIFTNLYGGVGAAATFSLVQIVITLTYLYLINRRFLKTSIIELYSKAFFVPITISIIVTIVFDTFISFGESRFFKLFEIGTAVMTCLVINSLLLIPIKEVFKEFQIIKTAFIKQ